MTETIFVVDDNDTNLAACKKVLCNDYKVFTIPSAATMFKLIEKKTPDLILLDIEMPDMDGFQAIAQLKADPRFKNIPVIFLTASQEGRSELKGFELGAVDFVQKPFSPPILLKRVETHLKMYALTRFLEAQFKEKTEENSVVTETLNKYLASEVVNELIKSSRGKIQVNGKTMEIAVLFVDIRGFTSLSENSDPNTIVKILNRYLTLTTECIMNNKGIVDKFIGDCTMAIWGAPSPQPESVYSACKSAIDMIEGSKVLCEDIRKEYGLTIGFGIGVHKGKAVVGNIGSRKRLDYTAIGDTVNTASRLESNAPAGTIYISRVVADELGDRAQVKSLGTNIKLKGKSDFEVLVLEKLF